MSNIVLKKLEEKQIRPGFSMIGTSGQPSLNLDPFLDVTLFQMSQPTFRPHPHAGFSAVTYMLPESKGSFQNRDSLGDQSLIHPGTIHWTQAGSGMIHEEIPTIPGTECIGFQIFVNLSKDNKQISPRAFHLDAIHIPIYTSPDYSLRIVSGKFQDYESPLKGLATQVDMFDLTVSRGCKAEINFENDYNYFIFCISGEGKLFDHDISRGYLAILDSTKKKLELSNTGSSHFRALIAGGKKLDEDIFWSGPFAMGTRADLQQAEERYLNGEMGFLESSF